MIGDPILDRPLLQFAPGDVWTTRDACAGVLILGGIGSGKTSGSGAAIARSFLAAGYGGLVLCAKPDERSLWERYARETGREDDLVVFAPHRPFRFNFLDYELHRTSVGGGQTENLVDLFDQALEIVEGKKGQDGGDSFWPRSMKQMLRNTIDVLAIAGEPITIATLTRFIAQAPQQPADVAVTEDARGEVMLTPWMERSSTFALIQRAHQAPKTPSQRRDLDTAARYWLEFWPSWSDKTRAGVVATFTSLADMLSHGAVRDLVATTTNITPEVTWTDGIVLVLDVSIQEYQQVGRMVQGLIKYSYMRSVLRRKVEEYPRPIFIWADEAQSFVGSFDAAFQAVARSARACFVQLTQNINNYRAVLGQNASAQADSLLGLSQTRIFHANADADTNRWAAEVISQDWTLTGNYGASLHGEQAGLQAGATQALHYRVQPVEFQRLRTGGPANSNLVDAVIFRSGQRWRSTNESYLRTTFRQH